jgi:exportin-5
MGGGGDAGSPRGGGGGGSSSLANSAHGGGKHIRDWMAAASSVIGSGAAARAGIATATAAVTWGDSEVGLLLYKLNTPVDP